MKKLLVSLVTLAMCFSLSSVAANPVKGTASYYVEGYENAPAVTRVVIKTNESLDLAAENFQIVETKKALNGAALFGAPGDLIINKDTPRVVTTAFYSDSKGNVAFEPQGYVTVCMRFTPDVGSPYFFDFLGTFHNSYCDPYELTVTYKGEKMELTTSTNEDEKFLTPQLDVWNTKGKFTAKDGTKLTYASFAPEKDNKKNPLFIWLHGAGEGGTDSKVVLLGNEVTALADRKFQEALGGAYVLAPQCETFWMDSGSGQIQTDGKTKFTESLKELIDSYVKANPDIDTNRIYIGGCSNGGFMTMDMIFNYPSYFAAAVPICEAYPDSVITDAQINSIKDLPVWMVAAATDTTVNPAEFILPTYDRLSKVSSVAKKTYYDKVVDLSHKYDTALKGQYEYNGHYSWVYFFNGEVKDENGTNLFDWLAAQHK